jgi:hypothetical protein
MKLAVAGREVEAGVPHIIPHNWIGKAAAGQSFGRQGPGLTRFKHKRAPWGLLLQLRLAMWGIVWGVNFKPKEKGLSQSAKPLIILGGDDETRTHDLRRDRPEGISYPILPEHLKIHIISAYKPITFFLDILPHTVIFPT